MTPEEILLKADDHLLTPSRGFRFKTSGVLREVKMLLPFIPAQVSQVTLEDIDQKTVLTVVKSKVTPAVNEVSYANSHLLFHTDALGKVFEIDMWCQNRKMNWNWFVRSESMLSNFTRRLKYSILSGMTIFRESGLHDMVITPGVFQYEDIIYTTPETIQDLRPEISMIPPRGSMLKVFFIHKESIDRIGEDRTLYEFDSITLFLGEGRKKEEYDSVISEEIYQKTDMTKADAQYMEIARVWVKDLLHRPPTLEIIYDYRVRRPNFLNWSI